MLVFLLGVVRASSWPLDGGATHREQVIWCVISLYTQADDLSRVHQAIAA